MMEVDWIVTNQSGVSFTKEEQTHTEMDDRWYTEKTIEYTTPACGADATFRCIAFLSDTTLVPLLDNYYSTVRIKTEVCKEPPSMEPTSSPTGQVAWPIVVIGIIIFFVVIVVLIACCLYCKKGKASCWCRRNGTSIQVETPDPHTQEMQKPKPKKKSLEEKKNILVEGLVQHYEKFCFIKPLPWGEPIPIDALYTTCQCTVTNANGVVSHHDSDFLSTPEFIFDCKNRVLIIADLGYGKTTYTQHLVSDWVSKMKPLKKGRKDKISEPILIYVHLKEVNPSMILPDLVKKMIHVGIDLTVDDIVEIFLNFEFQVLLDGLDELSMSTIGANASPEDPTNDKEERVHLLEGEGENYANLTVGKLLDNNINTFKFKKIKVWVTSREVDDMKASFALPYSKVKLNGFNTPQVNKYIHKTCKYYLTLQATLTLIPESNMRASKLDASQQAKSNAKNQETIEMKTTNNDSRQVTEGGCNNAENIKYGKAMKREENDKNINEVNEENKQTSEEKEQDKTEQIQTVDVEKLENEEKKDEDMFTEDGKNEANESNIKADEVSADVTKESIPAAHHKIKQGESKQKENIAPRNDMQNPEICDTLQILSNKVTECMELNEISQNFSETPLLLIMIVHIITCRMLDPTGKYKEVNVNKLTTIIRLVITCLESRYVQKVNKKSIQEDIKSLEARLGKIAFENKMSLSLGKREYWNDKLGDKDTELALAVGLLKYSKKVGSGGSQIEELAFSSYAGIMFYHEFFQEFLAAQYVPESDKEWGWIDDFIKKSTDDTTVRLLQFMFGMNHARLDKAVKSLLNEQKMWNNLIDCIYEISNLEKKQAIINGMYGKGDKLGTKMTINIQHLDRKHHRVAFTDFCDACNASDVKVRVMTFREECSIDFIKEIPMPSLKILIFLEMSINENQFVSIITSLANKKCPEILQFVKCSVPDELKEKAKETVELALKELDMKIYNCKKISPFTMSVPKFKPETGRWGIAVFPKDL
ncbi:uncharacterized protein [Apostichopus japonicus]|uniref:uncharacterized protein isoform X1 n=1 Tax=Stichopus japonicus TaxID=307972 RepID=UPI003AB89F0B